MIYIPEPFKKVAEDIISKNSKKKLSVKQLLYLFQCERRTSQNCDWINSVFKHLDLVVEPNFTNTWIHSIVELSAIPKVKMRKNQSNGENALSQEIYDPTPKLGLLSAANSKPISINKDAPIDQAITLMMINDYSQLPVMSGERKVDGMISWKSIGRARSNSSGREIKIVQDCMDRDVTKLDYQMPLLDAVNTVLEKEVILVKKSDDTICGIVTSTDVGMKFLSLSQPFLILEQIENHVRYILDGKFTLDKLIKAVNSSDKDRNIETLADLNFGEYIRICESEENWELLKLNVDRKIFIERLDKVRKIRNEVMHFNPDPVSDEDILVLKATSKFFYMLQKM